VRFGYGNGGWLRVDDLGHLGVALAGPLYVRLRPTPSGRWRITELYLDNRGEPITGAMLRRLPVGDIEALAQSEGGDQHLDARDKLPAVPLDVLASYYAHNGWRHPAKPRAVRNWVVDAYWSQFDGSDVRKVSRHKDPQPSAGPPPPPPPLPLPDGTLTDGFLRRVAETYALHVARGEAAPVKRMWQDMGGADSGLSLAAVRKWVYTARQRGIMPRGRQGRP
jgi:hypothetical protein